jgi:hypothetical protein
MKVDIDELIATMERQDPVQSQEAITLAEKERKVIATSLRVLKQAIGHGPFICGTVGEKDGAGLHDGYLICPALGLEGYALYKKEGGYTAPEW